MVSAGYVNKVHFVIDHFRNFDTFVQVKTDVGKVVSRYPRLDGKLRAYRLSHCIQCEKEESGTVLKRSTELIGPLVPHR